MSDKTISDYNPAGSIDAVNDYLLIEPNGNTVYNKINRNVLLGLSSAPLGTTDSQSPTNKTFDNTNSFTIKDGSLTLQNSSSTTKQAIFSLSSITAGQTRTLTVPDVSGTLTLIGAAQTLTSKTLTSPTINGGTIDNATITVDSIAGHTSATIVTIANLQISNGVLNSANAVTSTSVAVGAIQPQALVTGTGSGWSWQSWTPGRVGFSIGNGLEEAKYIQIGKTVIGRYLLTFGTTTAVSGSIQISPPIPFPASYYTTFGTSPHVGTVRVTASGGGYPGTLYASNATTCGFAAWNATSSYTQEATMNATVPVSWASGNTLMATFVYEVA